MSRWLDLQLNMYYKNIVRGRFIRRPNRFIAEVELEGRTVVCHVKNTGRCRELLTDGAEVILSRAADPKRRTEYDLVAVYKGETLINIDSQAPNKVFYEWVRSGHFIDGLTLIRPETVYRDSRFDLYAEAGEWKNFAEVKGVTLEENGVAMFPHAPTERGLKHLKGLISAAKDGYEAYAVFVIQMKGCRCFTPNRRTDPKLADAIREAYLAGVKLLCLYCNVTEDSLAIADKPHVSFII